MNRTLLQKVGAGTALLLVSSLVWAQTKYNLQEPQTEVARQMYDLHTIILVICLVICVGVFGMMFYSIIRHRKSVGHQAAQFHETPPWKLSGRRSVLILIGMLSCDANVLALKDTSSPT